MADTKIYGMRKPPPIKAAGQGDSIIYGSPLALIGIFVSVLRERFKPGNGPTAYPWYEDINSTKILIESSYEENATSRGTKPAIYVDKDRSVYQKNIIGDRAGHTFTDRKDAHWCLSSVPIIIECVSAKKGESAIIGDIVQWTLHSASDVIQKTFAFHDMSPPVMERTGPYEDDKTAWSTVVTFSVEYNLRWTVVPIAPILHEIILRIQSSGMSATEYLTEIAVRADTLLPDS